MFITIDAEKGITCSEKLTFEEAMMLIGSATLQLMHDVDEHLKATAESSEEYNEAHGRIYDMYNIMAGNILDAFDSDRSPSTDLTAQAILEAENAILDREVPTVVTTSEETESSDSETTEPQQEESEPA